jgi:hypothetical protein
MNSTGGQILSIALLIWGHLNGYRLRFLSLKLSKNWKNFHICEFYANCAFVNLFYINALYFWRLIGTMIKLT